MISLTKYAGFSHPLQGCGRAFLNDIPLECSFSVDPNSGFSGSNSETESLAWLDEILDQPRTPARSRLVDRWLWISEMSHDELTRLVLSGGVA